MSYAPEFRAHGKTIIMVMHDPLAENYAPRLIHMDKGRLMDGNARKAA